jgi:pimeloyl-ACP methyl ester carboxylesterase/ketosteroid isomerase-like protein
MFVTAMILAAVAAATPAEQVRDAELAFARAFANRDKAAFFAMVADDATFLSPGTTSSGKEQVVKSWSRYFEPAEAPFTWAPDRVSVSADGNLGLSTGPVYGADGAHAGDYISTWRREKDGGWKIVFDSNGPGPAVLPEHVPKIEEGFVTTPDGVKLFYRKIGRAPVTAIVPLDFMMFDTMKQFSNVATIITYDLRNRGRSTGGIKDATIHDDVKDLEAVRAHFKLEKFVPVGFSYLGKMVVMYAAEHPERVSRIIQLGPLGNRPVQMPMATDFGAPESVLTAYRESRKPEADPRQACLALANLMAYYMTGNPKNARKFDVAGACAYENEYPVNVSAHFASLMKTPATLTPEQLAKVTMPVLTIHGTKDRQASYEDGVAWVKSLPDARLVTVEGAAHALWLDEPAIVFAAMRQFLRGDR